MAKITKIEKFDVVADLERLPDEEKQSDKVYEKLVETLIRKRYSVSAELAILRQKDTKQAEYIAYDEYAEECKKEAKARLGIAMQTEGQG